MIEIKNLHKAFNGQQVLKGLSLAIPKGKVTVILGPSGCGKTVLLRHMIGLLKPDRGEVWVEGMNISPYDQGQCSLSSGRTCPSSARADP